MVYCADCGKRQILLPVRNWNESQYTYTCGTYHGHKEDCTPHTVKVMALHEIVLAEIQRVTQEAQGSIPRNSSGGRWTSTAASSKRNCLPKSKELDRTQKRLMDLEKLFRAAFEQLLRWRTFRKLSLKALTGGYEEENRS